MLRLLSVLFILLGSHVLSVAAGQCFSDQSFEAQNPPAPPYDTGKPCRQPPPGKLWACQNLDFPTVDCLVADITTCGVIGANNAPSIFYSFGVVQGQVGTLRDQVVPEGNYYVNCYDDAYWTSVISPMEATAGQGRTNALIARSAEAYAKVASGEILVFIEDRLSKKKGWHNGHFPDPWR